MGSSQGRYIRWLKFAGLASLPRSSHKAFVQPSQRKIFARLLNDEDTLREKLDNTIVCEGTGVDRAQHQMSALLDRMLWLCSDQDLSKRTSLDQSFSALQNRSLILILLGCDEYPTVEPRKSFLWDHFDKSVICLLHDVESPDLEKVKRWELEWQSLLQALPIERDQSAFVN